MLSNDAQGKLFACESMHCYSNLNEDVSHIMIFKASSDQDTICYYQAMRDRILLGSVLQKNGIFRFWPYGVTLTLNSTLPSPSLLATVKYCLGLGLRTQIGFEHSKRLGLGLGKYVTYGT